MKSTAVTRGVLALLLLCAAVSAGIYQQRGARNEGLKHAQQAIASQPLSSPEVAIVPVLLSGPLADRNSEISGLAWYKDYLILLPQYPKRLGNHLFALQREEIVQAVIEGEGEPLSPLAIPFNAPEFEREILGFEGFEAIAFRDGQAFLTIEAAEGDTARGYVTKGALADDLSEFVIDSGELAISPGQSNSPNKADESILLTDETVISIYEANGSQVNATPLMSAFDFNLTPLPSVEFPAIEYRVTDVTALDERDRFWAVNYFYEGDRDLFPDRDPLTIRFGRGETHRQRQTVERLVEFAYGDGGISLTETAPLQLALIEQGRNWEGIARFDNVRSGERGFLLATDKFPETILGYVALPEAVRQSD
ncbi:MAG: hypothetical protein AAFR12_20955 [Cyanobacteria bacterium J06626_6]